MNHLKSIVAVLIVTVVVGSCGKKQEPQNKAIATFGADSLRMDQVTMLVPDSTADSVKVSVAVLRASLAKACTASVTPSDTLSTILAQKLSLQSRGEWSMQGARSLFSAAKMIEKKLNELGSTEAVAAYVDSLFTAVSVGGGPAPFSKDSLALLKNSGVNRETLAALLSIVFKISSNEAQIVVNFLESEKTPTTKTTVKEMVNGLVYKAPPKKTAAYSSDPKSTELQHDNSLLALQFRPQQCIRDSIEQHLPELQSLYRKMLKKHNSMEGNIWTIFRIAPDGKVLSVNIRQSDIRQTDFINPFLASIKTIQFKPIPPRIGNMTFEFPFEFKAEM